ncbi:MAG: HAMP domain-containing histidine kinase [Planctomycetales bacterium]|nr:HAMP domain-containing histidine kinase [bacterium]UNM07765.1 MAG: HAMP domain-containing histidine kinase [Planctomycetales bacterium]
MRALRQFITLFRQPAQIWATDGRVLLSNSSFNNLFGLDAGFDWHAINFRFVEDPQIIAAGADHLIKHALSGRFVDIHSLEYIPARNPRFAAGRSEPVKLFLNLQPIIVEDGLDCIICVVSDYMAGGELMEQQLIRSQKMENLETLANGIAHEFNNLLTGIKGMTSLIMDEVEPESDVYSFALAIDDNIERGAKLIEQLLSYSREMPYMLKRTSIGSYFQDTFSMLRLQVTKRIQFDLRMMVEAEVMLDRHRMDQVIASLLVNARNAMGRNGQIIVTVSAVAPPRLEEQLPDVDWVCISIEDSGPGIPAELRERIFEPFFSTNRHSISTGLGLSVANKIVKLHNGILQAGDSEELGGAAMRIYLPKAEISINATSSIPQARN